MPKPAPTLKNDPLIIEERKCVKDLVKGINNSLHHAESLIDLQGRLRAALSEVEARLRQKAFARHLVTKQ